MKLSSSPEQAVDGLVTVKSPYSVSVTMDRFESLVKQHSLNVFARIDHAAGAAKISKMLRPTQLIIFGSPQGGTPFMELTQTVGIDLPLKVLVWEDASATVFIGYNDPEYLALRHHVANCTAVENLCKILAGLTGAAVEP